MSLYFKLPRARVAVFACALLAAQAAMAQTIEDHSLPKSAVKTYHVKCSGGGLAMIRYDTRLERPRVCASVQDGSKPQRCAEVSKAEIDGAVKAAAKAACS